MQLNQIQNRILSGFAGFEFETALGATEGKTKDSAKNFSPSRDNGCRSNFGNNIKVNQNCLNVSDTSFQGRAQAQNETAIAQDPNNPNNLIAASNDYLRGDGTCGAHWSNDGTHWNDATMPNGFVRGGAFGGASREYFQASGDPAVAWDTKGNAYYECMMFQRGTPLTNNPDFSSAIYLFRSTGNNGASWNFPGRPVAELYDTTGSKLLDKPYMTVDNHTGSPFQDRIYVTWTKFDSDGTGYIYGARSNDYGEHFSAPVVVSNDSALCVNTYGLPTPQGRCNENQFSQPFTGSDGALYVIFNNYNNAETLSATDNRNQILLAKSTNGGVSFGAPVKVASFFDLPDCATYQAGQDPGRACVPEKGSQKDSVFRAANYPSGAVSPKDPSQIAVTFGSYINKNSKESNGCTPTGTAASGNNLFTGVKTAGACNNKILLSVSTNSGTSFTGGTIDPRALPTVNQDPDQAQTDQAQTDQSQTDQSRTDQWWQWSAIDKDGKLAVSYYDRQYGNDETNGWMDISLSASKDWVKFKTRRVTSSSMPLPTQFPNAQGNSTFFGDYTGLTAWNDAYPLWMDTRNADLKLCPGTGTSTTPPANCTFTELNGRQANDQDIYTAKVGLP